MEKFLKSDETIKEQIIFWFLSYNNAPIEAFDGNEQFTLFDKLSNDIKIKIFKHLDNTELPVLVLRTVDGDMIVNTTRRFIKISSNSIDSILYIDFSGHDGYKVTLAQVRNGEIPVKTDGHFAEFGLRKNNGEIVFWIIPTGVPGFGFWNVTKKCNLIGRKYLLPD